MGLEKFLPRILTFGLELDPKCIFLTGLFEIHSHTLLTSSTVLVTEFNGKVGVYNYTLDYKRGPLNIFEVDE